MSNIEILSSINFHVHIRERGRTCLPSPLSDIYNSYNIYRNIAPHPMAAIILYIKNSVKKKQGSIKFVKDTPIYLAIHYASSLE